MPDLTFLINRIRSKYTSSIEHLQIIENIRAEIVLRPLEEFFEPVSIVDTSSALRRLSSINTASLSAWTKHIAYSTQVRMGALELAIMSELADDRLLSAMVLARSHLETAGLAALCEVTLVEATTTGDLEPLETLIPKTMLGTALSRTAKDDQDLREILFLSEQETITIKEAISAIDRFLCKNTSGEHWKRLYALLCDCSHPNPRGIKSFVDVLRQEESGWVLRYHNNEQVSDTDVKMAVEILSGSMRVGYAASELLRLTRFVKADDGFSYESPSELEIRRIWTRILQLPINAEKPS